MGLGRRMQRARPAGETEFPGQKLKWRSGVLGTIIPLADELQMQFRSWHVTLRHFKLTFDYSSVDSSALRSRSRRGYR